LAPVRAREHFVASIGNVDRAADLLAFLFFAMSVSGQLTVNRIPKRVGLAVGCVVLIAGLMLLAAPPVAVLMFISARCLRRPRAADRLCHAVGNERFKWRGSADEGER
jgi:hypothetical protein